MFGGGQYSHKRNHRRNNESFDKTLQINRYRLKFLSID